jgi:taurine dioxygenase
MTPQVKPFNGPIGASVSSFNLSEVLSVQDHQSLVDAWNQHSVLIFRDQTITPEQLLRFSRRFGDLEVHVLDQYLHHEHKEILVVSNIQENGRNVGIPDAGRYWHTDLSYLAEPSRGSILQAIEIPEENGQSLGNTIWASTAAAFDALPEARQHELSTLKAAFSLGNRFGKLVEDGNNDASLQEHQKGLVPEVIHPVVRTHPVTGRKSIYVNEGHTIRILGMPEDEGRELLQELWVHCTREEFSYRHKWRVGDVVMWDNVSTQHLAICDYALPQRRLLHRTTLTGDRPF